MFESKFGSVTGSITAELLADYVQGSRVQPPLAVKAEFFSHFKALDDTVLLILTKFCSFLFLNVLGVGGKGNREGVDGVLFSSGLLISNRGKEGTRSRDL